MDRIAIVGASLAGVNAAQTLRRNDYEGRIDLIGDEVHYPYDRPPLSKDYLTGEPDEDKLRLRPTADPDALDLTWHLGRRADRLDLGSDGVPGTIGLDDGTELAFDGLIIATGARPRELPGTAGRPGVHVLRSLDDARALRAAFDAEPDRVVVVGCGFIGAEVAASARERGLEVTIVEAAPAPLTRVLDHSAGMAVAQLHQGHGVDVRLATGVAALHPETGPVASVELSDGSMVDASVVVIGIGVVPNTEWLEGSGLTLDDGVVADETCLAAPGVVAVGDVVRWINPRYEGRAMRIEQWDNAAEMGGYGARRLLAWARGEAFDGFDPVPWFWSDQYDRKIQLAGVAGADSELLQGSHDEQRFVQLYHDDGKPTGVLCWNRPRQAIIGRQLLAAGADVAEMREKLSA